MNHTSKKRMHAALLLALTISSTAAPAFSWATAANDKQADKLGLNSSDVPLFKDSKKAGVAAGTALLIALVAQFAQAGVNGYIGDEETRALPRSVKDKLIAGARAAVNKDQLSNAGFASFVKIFKKDATRDVTSTVGKRLLEWVKENKTFATMIGLEVIGGVVVLVKEAGKNSEWNKKIAGRVTKLGDAKAWYGVDLDDKTTAELETVIAAAEALSGLTAAEIEKLTPTELEAKVAELAKLAKDHSAVDGLITAEKASRKAAAAAARALKSERNLAAQGSSFRVKQNVLKGKNTVQEKNDALEAAREQLHASWETAMGGADKCSDSKTADATYASLSPAERAIALNFEADLDTISKLLEQQAAAAETTIAKNWKAVLFNRKQTKTAATAQVLLKEKAEKSLLKSLINRWRAAKTHRLEEEQAQAELDHQIEARRLLATSQAKASLPARQLIIGSLRGRFGIDNNGEALPTGRLAEYEVELRKQLAAAQKVKDDTAPGQVVKIKALSDEIMRLDAQAKSARLAQEAAARQAAAALEAQQRREQEEAAERDRLEGEAARTAFEASLPSKSLAELLAFDQGNSAVAAAVVLRKSEIMAKRRTDAAGKVHGAAIDTFSTYDGKPCVRYVNLLSGSLSFSTSAPAATAAPVKAEAPAATTVTPPHHSRTHSPVRAPGTGGASATAAATSTTPATSTPSSASRPAATSLPSFWFNYGPEDAPDYRLEAVDTVCYKQRGNPPKANYNVNACVHLPNQKRVIQRTKAGWTDLWFSIDEPAK